MKLPEAKLIVSPTLVIVPAPDDHPEKGMFAVFDYLKKNFSYYPCETLHWISYFKQPHTFEEAHRDHRSCPYETLCAEIGDLIESGFIISEQEYDGPLYGAFRKDWKWDVTTALFHFTVTDNDFYSEQEASEVVSEKVGRHAQPLLGWRHPEAVVRLPPVTSKTNEPLYATMIARRTNRTSSSHPISAAQLGKCLFSGLGITGEVQTPSGWLPLGITPSGGARNPYEGYVILRRSEDLDPGIYHYSAFDHTLRLVTSDVPDKLSSYFANQPWVDDMSAIVVLAAIFERTMWKYEDPNAYRVVLIEAGHIAQNIMLSATDMGMSACPTAALSHSTIRDLLGLESMTHVPLYALTLDRPKDYQDKIRKVAATSH